MISHLKELIDLTPLIGTPPVEGVRYNPKKISRAEFLKIAPFRLEPTPFYDGGFIIREGKADGNHPYHLAGLYYFQEPSAMSAVTALQLSGNERVLDLCAAPGSKATAIASRLEDGLLVANEIQAKRAAALLQNLERMGARRAVITQAPAERLAAAMPEYFDKVLIDSPCSGEGMFRKYPRILEEWSEELVERCALRSRAILEAGAEALRPGGRLVYSTCTFNLEENEKTILWFLERHPDFKPVETGISGAQPGFLGLSEARRIFPSAGGEGHFVCALSRAGDAAGRSAPDFAKERWPEADAAIKSMLKERPEGNWICRGNFFYLLDLDLPCPSGIRILRAGMQSLELQGRQWKPAHHMAMCLPKEAFLLTQEFSMQQARQYLNGQVVQAEGRGWGTGLLEGTPIGWIKAGGGMGKNHLPKGLRTLN